MQSRKATRNIFRLDEHYRGTAERPRVCVSFFHGISVTRDITEEFSDKLFEDVLIKPQATGTEVKEKNSYSFPTDVSRCSKKKKNITAHFCFKSFQSLRKIRTQASVHSLARGYRSSILLFP